MLKCILLTGSVVFLLGCEEAISTSESNVVVAVATPSSSANIEPNSGMNQNSISTVMGIENKIVVFFIAANADPAQLAAAPAKLCASRGLRLLGSEIKDLDHPESMPGIRKLVATCG